MDNKKLLLATAVAIASHSAFAMEAMDEQSLSDTAGQAGLNITITPPAGGISFDMLYHDADGVPTTTVAGSTYTSAGALIIGEVPGGSSGFNSFSIANTSGFLIKVDAGAKGSAATSTALLNVQVQGIAATTIHTGDIRVGVSNAGTGLVAGAPVTGVVFNDMTVTIGAGNFMNIQLGNEDQGAMIKLTPTFTGGLTIANFALNDVGGTVSGGGIKVGTTAVKDCGAANCASAGANLGMDASVDANTNGLQIKVNSLGNTANGGAYVKLSSVFLGNTAGTSIGDVELFGLNLANTNIQVTGH